MNLKYKLLACALALPLLGGCGLFTPEAKETTKKDAQMLVDALQYVKAKNGLCFGVGTLERMSTNGTVAENVVLVPVECSSVGL